MKILYLSSLAGEGFSGLTYSVPNQINAQAEYDDVYWYNFQRVERDSWRKFSFYHNPSDHFFNLSCIKKRFGMPDLIVFEGFYNFHPTLRILDVLKWGIPYVIVPRCALTVGDQRKSRWKKKVCNAFFYKHFAKKAAAIHFLTEREHEETDPHWSKEWFVQPNGVERIYERPLHQHPDIIRAVYIGRLEIYQKGLDVLLQALSLSRSTLVAKRFTLSLYGNSVGDSKEQINNAIRDLALTDFVSCSDAVYDTEKEELLKKSDLFILTSRYEGMPMGLLEACSFGLPSLVTPGTNMADDIMSCKAGWVADFSPESIAEMLVRSVQEIEEYHELSLGALEIARKYQWSVIAEKTHRCYMELIAKERNKN